MVTVFRAHGLRVVIYPDDHEPAHVHVYGDGEAKVQLNGQDGAPQLVFAVGMNRGDLRRVLRVVAEQQDFLLACWRSFHG